VRIDLQPGRKEQRRLSKQYPLNYNGGSEHFLPPKLALLALRMLEL